MALVWYLDEVLLAWHCHSISFFLHDSKAQCTHLHSTSVHVPACPRVHCLRETRYLILADFPSGRNPDSVWGMLRCAHHPSKIWRNKGFIKTQFVRDSRMQEVLVIIFMCDQMQMREVYPFMSEAHPCMRLHVEMHMTGISCVYRATFS